MTTARRYAMQQHLDMTVAHEPVPAGVTLEAFLRRAADAVAKQTAAGGQITLESFKVYAESTADGRVVAIRAEWLDRDRPEAAT